MPFTRLKSSVFFPIMVLGKGHAGLRRFLRPIFFSLMGWLLCLAYLGYDYTIYHDVFISHLFSPPYLYELLFHVFMIIFSPVLFMFIGYQDFRKTAYLVELEGMTERWKKTYDSIPDSVFILDSENRVVDVNRRAVERWKRSFVGEKFCYALICDKYPYACAEGSDNCSSACPHRRCIDLHQTITEEIGDQSVCDAIYEITSTPLFGKRGDVVGTVHIVRDITRKKLAEAERKQLEAQLIQSQKMESMGRFASGIAHDFNNFLNVMLGNCEAALEELPQDVQGRRNIEQALLAAERAARLTASLRDFSRKKVQDPEPLDINRTIGAMADMIERIIGRDISLKLDLAGEPLIVNGSAEQLEQVIMNLAVNARDAMPGGGTLSFSTRPEEVSNIPASELVGRPDCYCVITVADTGHGMSRETLGHIFEPFYTTKEAGRGSGLGLSIVYTVVTRHGGSITVESEPDAGTTFLIRLPIFNRSEV